MRFESESLSHFLVMIYFSGISAEDSIGVANFIALHQEIDMNVLPFLQRYSGPHVIDKSRGRPRCGRRLFIYRMHKSNL
jgi:hypothetical protein